MKKSGMKGPGRPREEKPWDTNLRHQLSSNFLKEPDIHTLLFVSGTDLNTILRTALRDFMAKYQHPASDPSFRQKVFLDVTSAMASGATPRWSQLRSVEHAQWSGTLEGSPTAVAPGMAQHVDEQQLEASQSLCTPPKRHATQMPAATTNRREIELDFGGPQATPETCAREEVPPRPSQRDKWLARHQGGKA